MPFTYDGYGGNDVGGQALPSIAPQSIVLAPAVSGFSNTDLPFASRGPTNNGLIYTGGSGGQTTGFGQIFPTGRS